MLSLDRLDPDELARVCHEVGFFQLVDHGVDLGFIDEYFEALARFFALPDAAKATIEKTNSPWFRGWERLGSELTDHRVDHREQIDVWTTHPPRDGDIDPIYLRLEGPNQWPDEVLPGFRATVERFEREMAAVADRLMATMGLALGLVEDHFDRLFGERRMSLIKMIHYPETPTGEAGVNAHHDAGFLTLLWQRDVEGLQALNPDGEWIDVPPSREAICVNLGEILQSMTGNYFVATTHRVRVAEGADLVGVLPRPRSADPTRPAPARPPLRRSGRRQSPPSRRRVHGEARRAARRRARHRFDRDGDVRRTAVELLRPQLPRTRVAPPSRRPGLSGPVPERKRPELAAAASSGRAFTRCRCRPCDGAR